MTKELEELIAKVAKRLMNEDKRAQWINFVYCTCQLDNEQVTREMVEEVINRMYRDNHDH